MKKYLNYAFAGAIALTGAVGFASCSSSGEDVVGNTPVNNPTNIPEQEAVKTQFTISLPRNVARANTRQSAATVQDLQTIASFRGMDNIVLLPFAATGAVSTDPVLSTAYKLSDKISLTKIIVPNEQTVTNSIPAGTAGLLAGSNSVLYKDVTIPVGTGSFLFYGKAIDNGSDKFVNGSLTMTEGQPSAIKFDLVQTNASSIVSEVGTAIATYLSNIAKATNWAGCADPTNSSQAWYNASLGYLYLKFTSMKAGSSRTTQAAVQDLYTTIKDNNDAVSTAIKTAITNTTYVSSVSGDGVLTFTAAIGNSEATYFPGDVNLPDGAALLSFDSSTKNFTQVTTGNGNTGQVFAKYVDYVYPASLYYYCNSGIKTSNTSQQSAYNGTDNWATISGQYTDGPAVSTSTRSVAILDPIQYGVGRLDATVKLDAMTLYDKNGETYTVPAGGFTVTGILIGGQKQVGYNFKPTDDTSVFTIYDNITKSQSPTTLSATNTASATNYTLALETGTDPVKVAVELLNNGNAFEGADGIVPKGGKFYLIAELTPSSGTNYDSETMNQVFKQDYKTIVTFTIKTGLSKTDGSFNSTTGNTIGLGAAHNLIPDFRTPQLELGLSVDMTWESGLQFNVDL